MLTTASIHRLRLLGGLMALVALLAACDSTSPTSFPREVTNATDNFQFQATGLSGVTTALSYTWPNTGTSATINHATTTSGGAVRLTIRDSAGTLVYDKDLVPSLNEPTAVGVAGNWTIVVTFANYSGTINFRAQKL